MFEKQLLCMLCSVIFIFDSAINPVKCFYGKAANHKVRWRHFLNLHWTE